jgi:hypothetical protein
MANPNLSQHLSEVVEMAAEILSEGTFKDFVIFVKV